MSKKPVLLISLSFILPWASNWQGEAHWFLFGYSMPSFGFSFFQKLHAMWVFPLVLMIFGFLCSIVSLNARAYGFKKCLSNVMSAIFVLMAMQYFLQVYELEAFPPSSLTFNLPLSIGFFLGLTGALVSLAIGLNDLAIFWYGGIDQL